MPRIAIESGPHWLGQDRILECTGHHGGAELARGTGKNKKDAESAAALAAVDKQEAV
jgi:dsRNA-specific ribonuclease